MTCNPMLSDMMSWIAVIGGIITLFILFRIHRNGGKLKTR